MTELDTTAIRERAAAATAGPWETKDDGLSGLVTPKDRRRIIAAIPGAKPADGAFIAAARTDVPTLLDALDAARARIAKLEGQFNKMTALADRALDKLETANARIGELEAKIASSADPGAWHRARLPGDPYGDSSA